MRFHTIEVDDEVFRHLQSQAQPLLDTPNTVLRRLLLGVAAPSEQILTPPLPRIKPEAATELPTMPFGTPAALQQILWVTYLVRNNGRHRSDATGDVARFLRVTPQTVLDKYCRQLGLTAMAFDRLLHDAALTELRSLLLQKFPGHEETVRQFLSALRPAA
jgi:hypothetical protein